MDGTTPHTSAMLDISSDSLGVLIPRMTLSQRDAILSPATGLLIYQTNNTPGFYYYNGSTWSKMGGSGVSLEDGKILIGNVNNQAVEADVTGDASISNTGELSIAPSVITTAHIVDGTISGSDIHPTAGIQATSIAGASVNNTEYGYLDGANGNIQSQIDNNTAIFGTAGNVEPSKSVVVDANRDISNFNNLQADGTLTSGSSIVIDGTGTTEGTITESHGRLSFGNDTLFTTGVIGIGTSSPSKSAALDISSTNGGMLIPRMTRGQRNSITNPARGLMVYQTDNTPGFYYYNGTFWKLVGAEAFSINDLFDGRTAGNNVFLGLDAGVNDDSTNNQNVAVGKEALQKNTSGYFNTAVGYFALDSNTTGFQNTVVGYRTSTFNKSGSHNTTVGNGSNYFNREGSNNTIIGFQAGKGTALHNKFGSVFLGYKAGYNDTTDNKLYIDNSDTTAPLLYGEFDNDILAVNGSLGVGSHSPHTSSKLEVASTNKGFLPPRMTRLQRDAIGSPIAGLVVWCTNCGPYGELQVHNGNEWVNMTGGIAAHESCGIVTDSDGKVYNTVVIGTQCWMAENLSTTRYKDGSPIPLVSEDIIWIGLTSPGYCWYDNDSMLYYNTYGALYNWHAVNTGNLCPYGWHVPSISDWHLLITNVGGYSVAGGKLKETGWDHWNMPNEGATDEFGYTARPGGSRGNFSGDYFSIQELGRWWTATPGSQGWDASMRTMYYWDDDIVSASAHKRNGFSVRCIKD